MEPVRANPMPMRTGAKAVLAERHQISRFVWQLLIEPLSPLQYEAGQTIAVEYGGNCAEFALASVKDHDYYLEIQVKVNEHGTLGANLCRKVALGDMLILGDAKGNCFYHQIDRSRQLLLVADAHGIATCYGIVQDALKHDHPSPISLYHGVLESSELNLQDRFHALERQYWQFNYYPCIAKEGKAEGRSGRLSRIALRDIVDPSETTLYVSGQAEMVDEVVALADECLIPEAYIRTHKHSV